MHAGDFAERNRLSAGRIKNSADNAIARGFDFFKRDQAISVLRKIPPSPSYGGQATRLRRRYGVAGGADGLPIMDRELGVLSPPVALNRMALAEKTFPARIDRPVEAILRDSRR